jgi:hypothetical protein
MAFSLTIRSQTSVTSETDHTLRSLKPWAHRALHKGFGALFPSRQRDLDCEVARFIRRNGGQLTDGIEREISRRCGSPVLPILVAAALALGLLAPTGGHAGELRPEEGHSFDLGSSRGVAYYTVEPEGYRVVATLAAENASPVRVTAVLRADQSVTLSVPGALGEGSASLRIDRAGDHVTVAPTHAPGH